MSFYFQATQIVWSQILPICLTLRCNTKGSLPFGDGYTGSIHVKPALEFSKRFTCYRVFLVFYRH